METMEIFLECKSDNGTRGIKLKLFNMTCKALYNMVPFLWLSLCYWILWNIFNFLTQVSDFISKPLNMLVPEICFLSLSWLISNHSVCYTWMILLKCPFFWGALSVLPRVGQGPSFWSPKVHCWPDLFTSPHIHALGSIFSHWLWPYNLLWPMRQ